MRRSGIAVGAALAILLTACAPTTAKGPAVDTSAIEAGIGRLDGVTRVETGVHNLGVPGSYALATSIFVDDPQLDARALLIRSAGIVQTQAPGLDRYTFRIGVEPDPGEPVDYLPLAEEESRLGLPGDYRKHTLSAGAQELSEIAAATP